MKMLEMLLSHWFGWVALFTVLFATGMVIYIAVWAYRNVLKAPKEGQDHSQQGPHGTAV